MTWVIDLDGVVRIGRAPVPGAVGALARLRAAGTPVVFATNNAHRTVADQEADLEAMGVVARGCVVTAAQAAATLVAPGERVLVVGGPGLRGEVRARGCTLVDTGPCDAVVSGLDTAFDYDVLRRAGLAIRAGARWILANPDDVYPTDAGLEPGAGAIGAAIRAAGGREPVIAGKPHPPMVELVRSRTGSDGIVVGDRVDTDGALARALGYRFVLVLSGLTTPSEVPDAAAPWAVVDDLASLVASVLDGHGPS